MARLEALRASLEPAGLAGLLVSHLPNIRYLSGFTGSSALLLVHEAGAFLLTDFRYETQMESELSGDVTPRVTRDGLVPALAGLVSQLSAVGRIGFESERVTVRDRKEMGERCANVAWEPTTGRVEQLRAAKDEQEIDSIRRAAKIGDEALRQALEGAGEGVTEREVAADLDHRMRLLGSEGAAFDTIVASGPRTALPHARPSDRQIRAGDLLLLDFGATVQGYRSDMTRTVIVGSASEWQRMIYSTVTEALEKAIALVEAGRPARDVDAAARQTLDEAGMGERFGHSTGHGIGLEVHEAPRLHHGSDELLMQGNVVAVEPGVYFPARGGVRIEEDVVAEEAGCTVLTAFPRELIEI
ncbi:MAG: Xaa-Pro peptidase family protein [Gemmatimonadota bacterium]